jgi:hypothetical protein
MAWSNVWGVMQSGATKFLVEEAYWAASAEALRDFRAAAERLRPDAATANDNLRTPPDLREGAAD